MNLTERSITVNAVERLEAGFKGKGVLYSWIAPKGKGGRWSCQFDLGQEAGVEHTINELHRVSMSLNPGFRFPCTGMIAWTDEGYCVSPAIRLVTQGGK